MKIRYAFVIVFIVAFCLQGCAVGNKYNFTDLKVDMKASQKKSTAVAVGALDKREHIVSGRCEPTYVGVQRAGFGNPWRVNTLSGLPFSDDIVSVLSESLSRSGYKATPVSIGFDKTIQDAQNALANTSAERLLLIIVKKWESDTYTNIGLEYDLSLQVLDDKKNILAEKSTAETKTLPGSSWDPPSAAKQQVPIALKVTLENLLSDQKVVAALDTGKNIADRDELVQKNKSEKSLEAVKTELKKIQGLKDEGLINEDEYQNMKKKIIDKM